jgi:integrase
MPKRQKTCQQWIDRFHADYLQRGSSEATWRGDYWKVLKALPLDKPLTRDRLHELVIATEPNTKSRKRAVMVANAIARFAKIDYDGAPYRGRYSQFNSTKTRMLPDDATIAAIWYDIENPGYRWIYGMMATYGLRDHECFRLDFKRLQSDSVVMVQEETKTGAREVWPYHPEWVDEFGLCRVTLPDVDLKRTNQSLGRSVSKYFRVYRPLPFVPYDLRHRWAVRAMEYGLDNALASKQMGHSLEIHNRIYQRWIDRATQQKAYDSTINNPYRPKPPKSPK